MTLNTSFIMHMWIIIFIPRANTRRPARRRCRVAPSRLCRRLVTLRTAGRSRSSSVGYGLLRDIQPTQITPSLSWLHLFQLFFYFRIAESVQGQIREGKGQVYIQPDDRSSGCAARHGRGQESEQRTSSPLLPRF